MGPQPFMWRLRRLACDNCGLSGPLPEWSNMDSLQVLSLARNNLSGMSHFGARRLASLALDWNPLNARLEPLLGWGWPLLKHLSMAHCNPYGSLPPGQCLGAFCARAYNITSPPRPLAASCWHLSFAKRGTANLLSVCLCLQIGVGWSCSTLMSPATSCKAACPSRGHSRATAPWHAPCRHCCSTATHSQESCQAWLACPHSTAGQCLATGSCADLCRPLALVEASAAQQSVRVDGRSCFA